MQDFQVIMLEKKGNFICISPAWYALRTQLKFGSMSIK